VFFFAILAPRPWDSAWLDSQKNQTLPGYSNGRTLEQTATRYGGVDWVPSKSPQEPRHRTRQRLFLELRAITASGPVSQPYCSSSLTLRSDSNSPIRVSAKPGQAQRASSILSAASAAPPQFFTICCIRRTLEAISVSPSTLATLLLIISGVIEWRGRFSPSPSASMR
jgi:hypothetical protein